ncbi:MAG TPA: hypothetical protein VHA34_14615, partial [Actinomycetes bacterium]|nr:hypothetical protein [Actinomycetes bacterium]
VDRLGASAPPPPVPVTAPSLASLNEAIARAETFLDGLYRPLGPAGAVQSEHYGLPIRVRFPGHGRWVLLGQGHDGSCPAQECPLPTRIRILESAYASEAYELIYATPSSAEGLRLRARVDWDVGDGRYQVSVTALSFDDPATTAEVWLNDVRLGTFAPGPVDGEPPVLRRGFPVSEVGHLRSFRYTIRHATQLAWLHAVSRDDDDRSTALARLMLRAGFVPGRDLRAAIFGRGRDAPRDFSYRHEPFLDAYGDCSLHPPATPVAYPYRSKACLGNVQPYLMAARYDTLLPAIEALQALNRGESPDTSYRDQSALLPMVTTSASRTADDLERRFDRLGFGIPRCTPLACDRERASALRTFTFGMLETVLGYSGGEVGRRQYADAVANLALRVQIGEDGVVRAADRVAYRPALKGGFLSYWDAGRRYRKPTGIAQAMADRLNMPPEYLGLRPTDSETGFDAYAFLALYRCARYEVGCQLVGSAGPALAP